MTEYEKQYLARKIPDGLKDCRSKEVLDIYIPKDSKHPVVRIRKNGEKYEMTKKTVVDKEGHFDEQNIILSKEEFEALKDLDGKVLHKIRYFYDYNGRTAEVAVFLGDLKGLIVVEFEFDSMGELKSFEMPEFCLSDVTPEEFIAGGYLCGRKYEDIERFLSKYGYKKLFLE